MTNSGKANNQLSIALGNYWSCMRQCISWWCALQVRTIGIFVHRHGMMASLILAWPGQWLKHAGQRIKWVIFDPPCVTVFCLTSSYLVLCRRMATEYSEKLLCLGLAQHGQKAYTCFSRVSLRAMYIDDYIFNAGLLDFCKLAKEHRENHFGNEVPTSPTTETFLLFKQSCA